VAIDAAVEATGLPSMTVGAHMAHTRAAAISVAVTGVPAVVRQWAMPEVMVVMMMAMAVMVVMTMTVPMVMVAAMSAAANNLNHGLAVSGRL
jgi:hypothetical protein